MREWESVMIHSHSRFIFNLMDNKNITTVLAQTLGRDTRDINALLEGLGAIIKERCGNMDAIAVPGFGTFEPVKEEEYVAPDPETGRATLYPPKISLSFKPSAILKKRLTEQK